MVTETKDFIILDLGYGYKVIYSKKNKTVEFRDETYQYFCLDKSDFKMVEDFLKRLQ